MSSRSYSIGSALSSASQVSTAATTCHGEHEPQAAKMTSQGASGAADTSVQTATTSETPDSHDGSQVVVLRKMGDKRLVTRVKKRSGSLVIDSRSFADVVRKD
ncbi:hypothetical protein HIM_04880 [Hirsutella minnesotensis 3608]|uniref:Uncharacterized protein n=1 Tax=Hirsutella minnesotensis 3608 TaxID=1043627 RepID=A0A0F7ZUZ5_9HYPO|nr:hypothetical protein HIM_04880 [Hirsutella minnesotensis 3608]